MISYKFNRNPASISGFTKRLPSGDATQASASDATGKLTVESEAETFASRKGMRCEGSYEMGYDFAGRLTYDSSRDIRSITYDYDGLVDAIQTENLI